MPFISSLKESFATAPLDNRQDVVDKLAAANTEDATYYQGLILLQKIYDQVMNHQDPVKVRQATDAENELSKQMKDLLAKLDGHSARFRELSTRFYLLIYPFETSTSIEFIKKGLHLDMIDNGQPVATPEQSSLPSTESCSKSTAPCKLDPALLDGKNLIRDSFKEFASSTGHTMLDLEILSFPLIANDVSLWQGLSPNEQVALLKKLLYIPSESAFGPDLINRLATLWKEQTSDSNWCLENLPFYNFTLQQLDQLIDRIPNVVFLHDTFVNAYLEKLVPAEYHAHQSISFWDDDANVLKDYLDRLETFAEKLPGMYFTVNAAIKFHKLRIDIVRQDFCEERLVNYLSISSNNNNNNNAQMLSPVPTRSVSFGNSSTENSLISLPLLGQCAIPDSDKRLVVEEYLTGLVTRQKLTVSTEALGAYMDYHNILKPMLAEIMLTVSSDTKNQGSWAKSLGSAAYESLVSKSLVSFTPATINTCEKRKPSDAIKLQIKTKNISRLAIRVFQIDTENYWRIHLNDGSNPVAANSNINLDGLCPTFEKDMDYSSEPALLVKTTEFEFGQSGLAADVFKGRGLWVVEFVGGQHQCRVIVQKGYLRHVIQETPAGHVAKIVREDGQILENAKIWYNNQYYEADNANNILIPYLPRDQSSKMRKVILVSANDGFCEPASFYHHAEQYNLKASFYVNPEMVNTNKKATVVVVPKLTLNDVTVPWSLLQEKLTLSVDCTNSSNVKTSSTCQNIDCNPSYISFDFIVPEQLTFVDFHLTGKLKGIDGSMHEIGANHNISFCVGPSSRNLPCSVQLEKSNDIYFIRAFGKNGEPQKDYEVSLRLKHAFVNRTVDVLVKTNQEGAVELGELKDIQWIEFNNTYSTYKQWVFRNDINSALPPAVCVSAGKEFRIACPTSLPGSLYSLYATGIRSTLVRDASDKIQKQDGFITVAGLPEGEYMLHIPSSTGGLEYIKCTVIQSLVDGTDQTLWSNWLLGENRYGRQNGSVLKKPLTISSTSISDDAVQLQIENASPSKAFVVVTTSTFIPSSHETLMTHLFNSRPLPQPPCQENDTLGTRSIFLGDKRISEEYQYILNRSRSEKWVGSNLTKPSLLMYPKKNASTASNARNLENVEEMAEMACSKKMKTMGFSGLDFARGANCSMLTSNISCAMDSSFAFLDHLSPILVLPVPENGKVEISRRSLGYGGKFLQAVVVSGDQTVCQQTVIDHSRSLKLKDLSQHKSSNKALIRSKVISKLLPNDSLALNTHEYETIDSLEKLFDTVKTISTAGEEFAQTFYFLKTWSGLDLASKRELHDKHVCHELNLWLKKKDEVFFDVHVKPAIQSKIQKSFMDLYLLDQDLSLYQRDLYRFKQLDTVEKALFASTQSKDVMQAVARCFKDSLDDEKLDNRSDSIFDSILARSAAAAAAAATTTVADVAESYIQSSESNAVTFGASAPPPPPAAFAASLISRGEPRIAQTASLRQPFRRFASPSYSPGSPVDTDEDDDEDDEQDEVIVEEAVNELREKAKEQRKKVSYKYTESTSEWTEMGFFYQNQAPLKQFWIDYVEHHINCQSSDSHFLSENFIYCLDSPAELFYVLALMDLPFASNTDWKIDAASDNDSQSSLVISAATQPLMVFYRTLIENQGNFISNDRHNLMLGQEIFVFDPAAYIDSEECIKINPATQALESAVEYGSHLIISNVSSKPLTCQITVQIPTGSVPTQTTTYCKSSTIRIQPYSTWHQVVGTFYFPAAGDYAIVPVTVSTSSGDELIGMIEATNIRVNEPSSTAVSNGSNQVASISQSWSAIANSGSNEQVIGFLSSYRKLDKLDFSLIYWRMNSRDFARSVFDVLKSRYFLAREIWKYGVSHQFPDIIRDLLLFQSNDLFSQVGQVFDSPLVASDKLEQHQLLVLDYYPLLNARAHPLKPTAEILNQQFYQQYNNFLDYLSLKSKAPSDSDLIILTLYLLLQDRIGEAQATFARIQDTESPTHQVQFDYLNAYLKTRIPVATDQAQMQQLDLQSIKDIANKYKEFDSPKWRQLFRNLHDFVCEVEQGSFGMSDNSLQSNRILSEPILEFEVDQRNDELVVQYANVSSIQIKYYDMNIEVMFSNNPFMNSNGEKATSQNFNWIKPSYAVTMELPDQQSFADEQNEDFDVIGVGQVNTLQTVKVPFNGGNKNVFVEMSSGPIKRRQAYYANRLYTHLAESFGVVRVMSEKSKRPLAGAYIKVYARLKGGAVHFWKDGYTGLNGVFDYIGVTEGNELLGSNDTLKNVMMEKVDKLSILVLSTEEGATVKEAYPPNAEF